MLFLLLQHNRSHNCSRVSKYKQVATCGLKQIWGMYIFTSVQPTWSATNKGFAFNPTQFWQVCITMLSIALKVLIYCCFTVKIVISNSYFLKNLNTKTFATPPAHRLADLIALLKFLKLLNVFKMIHPFLSSNNYILRCDEVIFLNFIWPCKNINFWLC